MSKIENVPINEDVLFQVDGLLSAFAEVLDSGQIEQWPNLFTEEASYSLHDAEDDERGLPLAYILDDCRERLLDRVKFITEVWKGTVESYRTRHIVQRTGITLGDTPNEYNLRSNILVTYCQVEGTSNILCSGRTEDVVQLGSQGALFLSRRVILDGVPARYLVYPV